MIRHGLLPLLLVIAAPVFGLASGSDDRFLEELERRSFRFFWEQTNPATGLIADRAKADGSEKTKVASIASVGFGLSGICIAQQRGWISRRQAYERVVTTLRFLHDKLPNEHGFYYHFVDMKTGAREWKCELSSIDTALLMAGVLTVRQYYKGTEVERLATAIYERVDWPWMLNGGKTLSMGWTPEGGFLGARWADFSEHPVMYLMGLGSPTHPLPVGCWHAWQRSPVVTYAGRTFLQCPPLFTHQYSHAWVDFRDKRDAYANYFKNSTLATLAHRQFCMDLAGKFPKYGPNLWGITSSDGPDGYKSWGGPPATAQPAIDGTVVPCASGGSIPFAPRECIAALREMKKHTWTHYGFADAFNPQTGWVARDVIGIDVGVTLLMAENYRSGFVWKYFMRNPEIERAMQVAGFRSTAPVTPADTQYLRRLAFDTWRCIENLVEPTTGMPYDNWKRGEFTSVSNIGLYLTDIVAAKEMGFINRVTAERKIAKTLDSVKKLKTWHGFQQCWNSVKTLQRATHDPWVSVLDSGNLAGGLITVGEAFPKFRDDCRKLVEAMDWGAYYDPKKKLLLGGFNTQTGKFNPNWHLSLLGADSRLAYVLAIGSGKVPAESCNALDRGIEERHHARYLVPGWQGGGLFMQYINGLWLDERGTMMGQSAANFAYAQILNATNIPMPYCVWQFPGKIVRMPNWAQFWGWSASDSPSGEYLGWGKLRDEVVTPHASILAIQDFPLEAVANIRSLEKYGAREKRFGFYDAVDIKTGNVATNFLILDQSMILLSLANHLRDDCVRKHFQADPLVQRGRQLIADYRQPAFGANTALCMLNEPPKDLRVAQQKRAVARRFDDWRNADWHTLDAGSWEGGTVSPDNEARARFAFEWDDRALYFTIQVEDRVVINTAEAGKLYEQDSIELFLDPQNDGLRWGNRADCQFGFAVADKTWEWFGQRNTYKATTQKTGNGYVVRAAIPWELLGVTPARGKVLQVSPAAKSISSEDGAAIKLNWSWNSDGDSVRLGQLTLD